MRLYKKNLNQPCIVTWLDAKAEYSVSVHDFINSGFKINKTIGWLKHFDKECVVIATKITKDEESLYDLVMVPKEQVKEIEFIWLTRLYR